MKERYEAFQQKVDDQILLDTYSKITAVTTDTIFEHLDMVKHELWKLVFTYYQHYQGFFDDICPGLNLSGRIKFTGGVEDIISTETDEWIGLKVIIKTLTEGTEFSKIEFKFYSHLHKYKHWGQEKPDKILMFSESLTIPDIGRDVFKFKDYICRYVNNTIIQYMLPKFLKEYPHIRSTVGIIGNLHIDINLHSLTYKPDMLKGWHHLSGLNQKFKIEMIGCDGQVVRTWKSTGKVSSEASSDGYFFMDAGSGKLVEVTGNLIITEE